MKDELQKLQDYLKAASETDVTEEPMFVVMFPKTGLTLSWHGRAYVEHSLIPHQYSMLNAEVLVKYKNGNGDFPIIVTLQEYYSKRIELTRGSIDFLEVR